MSRRLRRLPALLVPLVLATSLAACGSNDSSKDSGSADALHGVKVSGAVGSEPKVTWNGKLDVSKTETSVLTKGDGETVADGDQVVANIWVGNGFSQKKAYSTYDEGAQPETVTASADLAPVFKEAILDQKVGSRVAVTATGKDAFGPSGNSQLQVAPTDSVLIIVDLMKTNKVLDGPQGKAQKAPSWAPKLTMDGDNVTALDFTGTPKPDGKLRSAVLIQGEGDTVQKGQTITANYLGQVYKAPKPFDASYGKAPMSRAIGVGQLVPGWDKRLVGQKVGSRVMLAIPPADGYGKTGNAQAGIKGTDTLYFVVDILAAS